MKAAVIDLGTNTFHLIIAEITATEINISYKTNDPVRLGQGRINENIIIPEAFERGINTLKSFKKEIDKQGITTVKAIATSAIRSAANGTDFVKAAFEHAGIAIEVVTGDQEAEYIFKGVKATGVITQTSLVMDIGGGSTEFIICNEKSLLWKRSYDIGAARLMQAYFKSDPINESDQSALIEHVGNTLTALKAACIEYQPAALIGSAGAFETFAGLLLKGVNIKEVIATRLDTTGYHQLAEMLIRSTHEERENIAGLIPLRVDMIVIAALLTNYVIENMGLKELYLSTYDLKMGVLQALQENLNGN